VGLYPAPQNYQRYYSIANFDREIFALQLWKVKGYPISMTAVKRYSELLAGGSEL